MVALERVHLQYCKRLLGVKKCTQNDFVYGELGRMPLQNHRFYSIVKFWIKILLSDSKKYIRLVYNMLYQDILDRPNIKNWCSLLRDLLFTLGFQEVWYFQTTGDPKLFLSFIRQRLNDQFLQNWTSRIEISSRAIFTDV